MSCLFILLVIIQSTPHRRILKCIIENSMFLLLWGLKMQMKISFMVLEIWSFGFGEVLEIILKEFLQTLYKEHSFLGKI